MNTSSIILVDAEGQGIALSIEDDSVWVKPVDGGFYITSMEDLNYFYQKVSDYLKEAQKDE